ncbi:rRNA maturation RNase YbeY [Nonlabens ponticola]|uniref:Endoribonuclease YbeY n=1 Tax=Nonlabens ponticola TaxID=2496866 RepID=A0A3S9MVE6_9FLAO|nr:rRNA maturation RNase YbeY [Nonlabens ponticola]AZQ43140.1 rRNA maturation RNase YbeY [Nonlabens ponticola]
MIEFDSQNNFEFSSPKNYIEWLNRVADSENCSIKSLNYVFCSDEFLLDINQQHLNHDTFTDIITFDYSVDDVLEGEIYISTDRVNENAFIYNVSQDDELRRVMVHGLLHMIGYGDKTDEESAKMRLLESQKMQMFHVKQ